MKSPHLSAIVISLTLALTISGCATKQVETHRNLKLRVDVIKTVFTQDSQKRTMVGDIAFFYDNTFKNEITDPAVKSRVSSIMNRIIADGKAPSPFALYNSQGSRSKPKIILIGERGFLRALLSETMKRVNFNGDGYIIRFRYHRSRDR